MSCRRASALISASLDRTLTRREKFSLRYHLLLCRACNRFRRQSHALRNLFTAGDEIIAEPPRLASSRQELSPEARARIRDVIESAS